MRQPTDSVIVVIRPSWTGSAEQERLLEAAVAAVAASRKAEEDAWKAVQEARRVGVPDLVLVRRADLSKATMNRKLGPRPA